MIAHVAQSGEDRGRVVIRIGSGHPSTVALEAAVRIARAFGSDLESLFVEDEQLFDCAAYGFVHGNRDGFPYRLHRRVYEPSIEWLRQSVDRAKVEQPQKVKALKALAAFAARL